MIRERRQAPPARPTLTKEEMIRIIQRVENNDVAFIFALQAFLCWRYDSMTALRPEHITVREQDLAMIVVKEKVVANQMAPRDIQHIPRILSTEWPQSAYWQPVVDRLLADIQRGNASVLYKLARYDEFVKQVKSLLSSAVPRLHTADRVGTHIARRTGASLHLEEGWSEEAVMYLGGWSDAAQFHVYIQSVRGLVQIDRTTH